MPRAVAYIALVQLLLVIAGFVVLGIVLKVAGYPDFAGYHWNPLAVLLRKHGLWFLVAPVLWALFAIAAEHLHHPFFSQRLVLFSGVAWAGIVTALFFYAAVFPYTISLIFHRP